jgi:hypothetical protein
VLLCAAAQQQTREVKKESEACKAWERERNLQEETREGEKQRSRWKTKQPASVGERRGLFWHETRDCFEV